MNLLKKATLAVALGATALTAAAPAEAQYRRGYRHHDDAAGAAVVAGIAGLAIGAAIASGHDRYRDDYYRSRGYGYDYDARYYRHHGYYPRDGYYAYRYRDYRDCYTERRWDPYYGRRMLIQVCR